jgi:hypothetical protein
VLVICEHDQISFVGVCWKGGDGRKHLFVGIDDAMQIGLRAPSNVFGHRQTMSLVDMDQQLSQRDHDNSAPVTKIVFGRPFSYVIHNLQQRQGNTQTEFLQSTTFRDTSVAACTQNWGSIFISITGTAPCYIDSLFFRALLLN